MKVEQYDIQSEKGFSVLDYNDSDNLVKKTDQNSLSLRADTQPIIKNNKKSSEVIFFKDRGKKIEIEVADILYCKAERNYCRVTTATKKFFLTMSLKVLHTKINTTAIARIHRSYLVNLKAVDGFENNCVHICNATIPISRSYRKVIINRLHRLI